MAFLGLLYKCMGYIEEAKKYWRKAADIWEYMGEERIGEYIEEFEMVKSKLEEYK